MAFQSHLLEVAGDENSVYYVVAKSMLLLPLSFASVLIGMYFDFFPNAVHPVYIAQIALAAVAMFFASRLRLFLYPAENTQRDK